MSYMLSDASDKLWLFLECGSFVSPHFTGYVTLHMIDHVLTVNCSIKPQKGGQLQCCDDFFPMKPLFTSLKGLKFC